MTITRRTLLASSLVSAAAATRTAHAEQPWPNHPVRMIVTQSAGGTPDIICRLVADRLSQSLGETFVVENHAGAANIIGTQLVARAAPDGYTLLWATAASLVTNPFTMKDLPYDPFKDFVTVARVAKGPFLVVANPALPASNLRDVIALAKAKPGELTIATDGPRNFSGLVAAWLAKQADIDLRAVPYANMPQGIQDAVSGRVQLAIIAIPSAAPMLKSGMLKAIAISSQQRAPGYENVAPIADDLKGFDFYGWMGIAAPARTPAPIIEKLNAEMNKILVDPGITARLADIGFYSFGAHGQAEVEKAVQDEIATWRRLVAEIGIQPE